MDGLIPMVYKSLKRNKTLRQYKWLSPSSPAPSTHRYNIADFHTSDNVDRRVVVLGGRPDKVFGDRRALNRRYSSVHVEDQKSAGAAKHKQLVRFRSHKVFSCCVNDAA